MLVDYFGAELIRDSKTIPFGCFQSSIASCQPLPSINNQNITSYEGLWRDHTKHNDHEVAKPNKARSSIGIVTQTRRPCLFVNRSNVSVFLPGLLWRPCRGCGCSVGAILSDVVGAASRGRTIRGFYTCRCSRIHLVRASPRRQTDGGKRKDTRD